MPILETRTANWPDEAHCAASAQALAAKPGVAAALIELHGTLGAGKTSFVRHLLGALGVRGRVKSPTYTIMESYDAVGFSIGHFDFYRLNDPQEFEDAGLREVFANPGLKLVEWPDKAAGLLPLADLVVSIQFDANPEAHTERRVSFAAQTELGLGLLP